MQSRLEIRRGVYHDSVVLMRATSRLRGLDGIDECLVAMATPLNIGLLRDLGFDDAEAGAASTTDLVVAVRGQSDDAIERALAALDAELSAPSAESGGAVEAPASLRAAVRQSEADLVIVSVPGPHAVPEAVDALLEGADVMVFSDGVSLDAERRLKALAESRGRLVMGPDCGTARLGGVGLGFCNNLAGGDVGIVAASGTGAQHVACLLEGRDIGVGHIIGVGGRDMSDDIGGVSALRALAMLEADPATGHVVVISKAPGSKTARRLEKAAAAMKTPVTFGFLGGGGVDLTAVARAVAEARGAEVGKLCVERSGRDGEGGQLVGLFSGGTLAGEAAAIVGETLGQVAGLDDVASPTAAAIAGFDSHFIVDLGDDRLTVGRPHPMIDATLRREIIEALAARPSPRVLFIDIVLGFGADADPVGAIAGALGAFLASDPRARVVATVVGTARDPQGYAAQWRKLADLGCDVYESNAEAARAVAEQLEQ